MNINKVCLLNLLICIMDIIWNIAHCNTLVWQYIFFLAKYNNGSFIVDFFLWSIITDAIEFVVERRCLQWRAMLLMINVYCVYSCAILMPRPFLRALRVADKPQRAIIPHRTNWAFFLLYSALSTIAIWYAGTASN